MRELGSSEGNAIADDTLKDAHVAGWLLELESPERERWLECATWVRRVDRLAEAGAGLAELLALSVPGNDAATAYVHATDRYRGHVAICTVAEHEEMLGALSGSLLLSMPDPPALRDEVIALGAVDQLYNDVRDVIEDVGASVCRFPTARQDLLAARFDAPGVRALFRYSVDELGPRLRARADALRTARLSPTWRRLVTEFDARHDLLEYTVRASYYDAPVFTERYWSAARAALLARRVRRAA